MDDDRAMELLEANRDLTPEEQRELTAYAEEVWHNLPYTAGVALERARLRELWLALETSTGEDYLHNLEAIRAALGIR